jgi:hypothetical protein
VATEYEYYVKQEQIRAEQAALREQMKTEAAERKALAEQEKKLKEEEEKYLSEIVRANEQMESETDPARIEELKAHIINIEALTAQIKEKTAEITKLQNGQAGKVYVISNIGSFGEEVFKIGMTRRLDVQDRVNELGDASVPFPFDIHASIFSENAPTLEHKIHEELNNNRVNRVNSRKEFFKVNIDELEDLVYRLQPSAEFNKTYIAEQYRQSMSIPEVREMSEDEADNDDADEYIDTDEDKLVS